MTGFAASIRRLLLNRLLRCLVKPIWKRKPTVGLLRRRAAWFDRSFGAARRVAPAQNERIADHLLAERLEPPARTSEGAVLYLHGGGFCLHLPALYRDFCADLARRSGVPVWLPDYRLAPEHPAPAALDDCELAYRHLLRELPAERIVLVGDSAGGNLALALLQRCKRLDLPMPAGAVLLSPLTEFDDGGWSTLYNERADVMFSSYSAPALKQHYLCGSSTSDPEISPLYGDWSGLPPLRFHVSSTEMLLDHSLRAADRACEAGVDAKATVWPDLPHVFAMFGFLEEARQCRAEMAAFVSAQLAATSDRGQRSSSVPMTTTK